MDRTGKQGQEIQMYKVNIGMVQNIRICLLQILKLTKNWFFKKLLWQISYGLLWGRKQISKKSAYIIFCSSD
jgi:hypothetical protein